MAVTALILYGVGNGEMSDAQIKAKALELGMVYQTGSLTETSEVTDDETGSENEITDVDPENTDVADENVANHSESENEVNQSETDAGNDSDDENSDIVSETDVNESENDTEVVEEQAESETDAEPATKDTTDTTDTSIEKTGEIVSLTVRSGSGSDSVCRSAKDLGLVTDAADFDRFLCGNGYANRIRVGTFEIEVGSTYEEIAKILTGAH